MKNKYVLCCLCDEIVYLYKKDTKKTSELFFRKHRAVSKNSKTFCLNCYKQLYQNSKRKINYDNCHSWRLRSCKNKFTCRCYFNK
ncbi:unknown [Euproctis pseudoconspersa nucleopolyhedrovirus]|uniref:Ac43 n=1 Tax=Euproctis pseudoconspersa nucleopolyhedrovirus TaxID=307467 RepID=C3TWT5_9ABAC|nr:hypothetical protein EupsNPV_gp027 [Euproctis pseudoconspersa nucleopolyhedrovirus]ACO53477.1 unknown [Euproctis pseudoconspersa nucleopolyhedrovirus]QUJ09218.1 hypothetical protein Gyru_ORF23 [Gynaephora ruoergensis nucleopolyhedrovirus]